MSSNNTVDPPLVDSRDRIFLERLEDGMYASVNKQILERPTSLALLEYIGTKKRPATMFRGVDWANNLVFNDGPGKNANEIRATMFGEIAEPVHGTMVSARGNHYEGNTSSTFKPIDDKTKVKDVLVLRAPSLCGIETSGLWNNQRALLQDIIAVEKNQDAAFGWQPFYNVPFRSSTTDNPRDDMIAIYTQKKYGVPASAGAPASAGSTPPSTPQKTVRSRRAFVPGGGLDSDNEDGPGGSTDPISPGDHSNSIEVPGPEKIFLGAFYDPRLLEDFGGPSFQLVKARLRQLDHRGANNKLIPPWNHYSAFRPGSLIVATVSIHIYTFKAEGTDRDKDRKIFQIEAHTIRVLDESDFPVEKRLIHVPRHMVDQPSPSTGGNSTSSVADSLTNFVFTPRKKRVASPAGQDDEMDGGAGGGGEGSGGDAGGDGGSPSKRRKSNKK